MTHTLAAWWPLLRKRLPAVLVGPQAGLALSHCAGVLPGPSLFAFECRLAATKDQVDLSFRIDRDHWSKLCGPFAELRAGRRGLPAEIERLWIELDLPLSGADSPAAKKVDKAPQRPVPQKPVPRKPILCAELPAGSECLLDLLHWLHGRPLAPSAIESIEAQRRSFPPEARVLYAFDLGSRPGSPVRLEWVGVSPSAACRVLRPFVPEEVLPAVERGAALMDGVERPHLSYDFRLQNDSGVEVLPRIGLEGSFTAPPEKDRRWRGLLDRWIAAGLCDPAKAAASLDFSGVDTYWSARGDWPTRQVGLGGHAVRRVSHLKLVARPNGDLEAKVYLLFQYLPS